MPQFSELKTEQVVPFEDKEPQVAAFPIVGVGASEGGLEAFSQLLQALPTDTGMAFVLIQHLDPTHKSDLTSILCGSTHIKVSEITDGIPIEPNHVYVIPPNRMLQFTDRAFHLTPRPSTTCKLHGRKCPRFAPASVCGRCLPGCARGFKQHRETRSGRPVSITLNAEGGILRLSISDKGHGFDPVAVRGKGGLGIVTMQERAHLLGGDLQIESHPEQGTTVRLEIPLPKQGK